MKVYELLVELVDSSAGYELRFIHPSGEIFELTGDAETDTSKRVYDYVLRPAQTEED